MNNADRILAPLLLTMLACLLMIGMMDRFRVPVTVTKHVSLCHVFAGRMPGCTNGHWRCTAHREAERTMITATPVEGSHE